MGGSAARPRPEQRLQMPGVLDPPPRGCECGARRWTGRGCGALCTRCTGWRTIRRTGCWTRRAGRCAGAAARTAARAGRPAGAARRLGAMGGAANGASLDAIVVGATAADRIGADRARRHGRPSAQPVARAPFGIGAADAALVKLDAAVLAHPAHAGRIVVNAVTAAADPVARGEDAAVVAQPLRPGRADAEQKRRRHHDQAFLHWPSPACLRAVND
jgi:hypothetical protein